MGWLSKRRWERGELDDGFVFGGVAWSIATERNMELAEGKLRMASRRAGRAGGGLMEAGGLEGEVGKKRERER